MFDFNKINFKFVIVIIIIVMLLFLGGRYLFKHYRIDQPLENELMELQEVEKVELISNENKTDIKVKLNRNTDLYNIYLKIEELSQNHLEDKFNKIILEDNSNSNLEKIYYETHYAVFEGLATFEFTDMKSNIEKIMENKNIDDYEIRVDNERIYLKFVDGDNYMFKTISRQPQMNSGGEKRDG
ncbi:MAG: hypothetical protein ACOCRK_10195 [bacterium]